MKKQLFGLGLFVATATTVALYPTLNIGAVTKLPTHQGTPLSTVPVNQARVAPPKIEVVFALDTTGSMGGLLAAAKENIWSIATTMAQADPAPDIRMGIVAYRDRGDAYVTRVTDLSSDLDSMYGQLMDLQAAGGGDGPEAVNQALADAVQQISWSEDNNTYRVVFLVGDAPPHMDYNEIKYPEIAALAKQRGIVLNAIRCGQDDATRQAWQTIASLAGGEFMNVGQHGSAVAVATPFDASIASLSMELDKTRMVIGDAEQQKRHALKQQATKKLHAEASTASRARRASFNASGAGKRNLLGEHDLIEALEEGRVDLAKVAAGSLPAPLRQLAPGEREQVVKAEAKKRRELNSEIAQLAKKRDRYIQDQLAAAGGAGDSLDDKIYATVKQQSAEIGLSYDAPAKY